MAISVEIIPYQAAYEGQAKALLHELQEHLVACDGEDVQVLPEYYDAQYLPFVLRQCEANSGAVFLAVEDGRALGLAAGYLEEKDEEDRLTNRCPRRGIVSELVVLKEARRKAVGQRLLAEMEAFFREKGCEFIAVSAFAPNKAACDFYEKQAYAPRNIEFYKRIGEIPQQSEAPGEAAPDAQ